MDDTTDTTTDPHEVPEGVCPYCLGNWENMDECRFCLGTGADKELIDNLDSAILHD